MISESPRALVFPGQGVQEHVPEIANAMLSSKNRYVARTADETYQEAEDTLHVLVRKLSLGGLPEELNRPGFTEPAILTASIAAFRILKGRGIVPSVVAGHSMGEYSAIVAAEALSFEQALKLVRSRGEFMDKAGQENPGKMAAVLGLSLEEVEAICEEAGAHTANINGLTNVTISGTKDSVARVSEIINKGGYKKVKMLEIAVGIAAHSPLMEPARQSLEGLLEDIPIWTPRIDFVQNTTGELASTATDVKRGLIDQMTGKVMWLDTIRLIQRRGIHDYVEVGPGEVLTGMIRRIDPFAKMTHVLEIIGDQKPALL